MFEKVLNTSLPFFKPFVPNASFLYPPENIRTTLGFLIFAGERKGALGTNELIENSVLCSVFIVN